MKLSVHVLLYPHIEKGVLDWNLNACDALTFLLDNIFIRFGTKLYIHVVGISIGTNCTPLVANLFLFCYERDFMMSFSDDKQAALTLHPDVWTIF